MSDQIIFDDSALLRAIDNAIALLSRPQALLEEIGAKLELSAQMRFDSKTDPAGEAWPQLAESTVNYWYKKKYPNGIPGTLLSRTNILRESLSHYVEGDSIVLGTSRQVPGKSQPYWDVGVLHEWGTVIMPRRGILTADPETATLAASDQAAIISIVQDALLGAFE